MTKANRQEAAGRKEDQIEITVPPLGETVETALLARWLKKEGELTEEGDALLELETDKISLEVPAPRRGILRFPLPVETEVRSGEAVAKLDINPKAVEAAEAAMPVKEKAASPAVSEKKAEKPEEKKSGEAALKTKSGFPPEKKFEIPSASSENSFQNPSVPQAEERRLKLSPLRQAVARNLKEIQNQAAVLTTFTEIDMSGAIVLRKRYRDKFAECHEGAKLGFMSFFAAAAARALCRFPVLNAYVEGEEAVYRRHANLGIAVTTDKGLVVPVIAQAEELGFAVIEQKIADFAQRARTGRLVREDLANASFTLTNGGVFGSLLSTPLLSPKQSGVLGLHAIKERPVALNGEVVIRPMMYAALSYDHRLVDGKEGVSFLRTVKELVEDPARLLLDV